jgi:hypothetical protein
LKGFAKAREVINIMTNNLERDSLKGPNQLTYPGLARASFVERIIGLFQLQRRISDKTSIKSNVFYILVTSKAIQIFLE